MPSALAASLTEYVCIYQPPARSTSHAADGSPVQNWPRGGGGVEPRLTTVPPRFCYFFCPVIHLLTVAASDSSSSAISSKVLPAVNSCRARSCRWGGDRSRPTGALCGPCSTGCAARAARGLLAVP